MIKNNNMSVNEYKYRKYKYKYNLTRGGSKIELPAEWIKYDPITCKQVYWKDISKKPLNTIYYFGLMFKTLEENYTFILEQLNSTQIN